MMITKNAGKDYYTRTEILHANLIQNKEKLRYWELNLVNIGFVLYTTFTFPKDPACMWLLHNKCSLHLFIEKYNNLFYSSFLFKKIILKGLPSYKMAIITVKHICWPRVKPLFLSTNWGLRSTKWNIQIYQGLSVLTWHYTNATTLFLPRPGLHPACSEQRNRSVCSHPWRYTVVSKGCSDQSPQNQGWMLA